ncbi:MAG: WG repeat-containing protein [Clostridia bacterium]|nr:WG repeat-containing protein [Clostridia bacterium]
MNLIDENIERESEDRQKRLIRMILVIIAVLITVVVVILIYSGIKKKNTLTVTINDEKKNFNAGLFLMADKKNFKTSENGEIYISVRELSNMLGDDVGYLNDEYDGKGEDVTKCQIKEDNEYTSYISGSSTIYKVRDNKAENDEIRKNMQNNRNNNEDQPLLVSDNEYEYFKIDQGVIYENNEIYASESAIELGFNVNIIYDEKNKSVKIYTLDGLMKKAADRVGASVVTDNIDYYNKKLLKYGFVLVKKSNNEYGIQDYINYQEGNYVLSCKYSDIKFIESLESLIVTTSDTQEKGILRIDLDENKSVETLVEPKYREINQITEDGSLYAIKENGRYGLLKVTEDENGVSTENVLKCEYQTIGIDNYSDYEEMNNRFLINGKYIPIKRDNKWGLATREGKVAILPQYDEIGCNISKEGRPAICVPNLKNGSDGIVFGITATNAETSENKTTYVLINADKKDKIGYDSSEIYSTYLNNEKAYTMKVTAADGTTYRLNIYDAFSEPAKQTKKTNLITSVDTTSEKDNTEGESNN